MVKPVVLHWTRSATLWSRSWAVASRLFVDWIPTSRSTCRGTPILPEDCSPGRARASCEGQPPPLAKLAPQIEQRSGAAPKKEAKKLEETKQQRSHPILLLRNMLATKHAKVQCPIFGKDREIDPSALSHCTNNRFQKGPKCRRDSVGSKNTQTIAGVPSPPTLSVLPCASSETGLIWDCGLSFAPCERSCPATRPHGLRSRGPGDR